MSRYSLIKIFVIVFILIVPDELFPQKDSNVVASIGKYKITAAQFKELADITYLRNRTLRGAEEQVKKEFLHTLIANKLFAIEAEYLRLDTLETVNYSIKEYEKMFVRDALFNKEIQSEAKKTANILTDKYLQISANLKVNFISSQSEKEINNIYSLLQKKVNFDTLFLEIYKKNPKKNFLQVEIGTFDEEAENILFATKVNHFTPPIKIENTYYIFHIISREIPSFAKNDGWESELKRLNKIALDRAVFKKYKEYTSKFFIGKKIEANGVLLKMIAGDLYTLLKNKYSTNLLPKNEKYFLKYEELNELIHQLNPDSLSSVLIYLGQNKITLRNFLQHLYFEKFFITKIDYKNILFYLNKSVKDFIELELLAEEGYREGLHKSKEVMESLQPWREYLLSQAYQNCFNDSGKVSETEIFYEYQKIMNRKKYASEVKINKILVDSLDKIPLILDELKNGTEFYELMKKYSIDSADLNKNPGYENIFSLGEVGRIIMNMSVGEVYGPLSVDAGYIIIKLVDKKEADTTVLNYETMKDKLIKDLSFNKMRNSLVNTTVKLAEKYHVEINYTALKNVVLQNMNTVVYRFLGFGGRQIAAPFLNPFEEWVEPYFERKKELP